MRNSLILFLLLALAGSLIANRNSSVPQEGIRYVNLDFCLQQWNNYSVVREQLTQETQQLTKQISTQAAVIQGKRDELELLDPASVAGQELSMQITVAEDTLKFQQQMAGRQMQERSNSAFSRALVEINQACAEVGEQNGYSAIVTIPADLDKVYPDSTTKLNQLSSRLVNWTNPAYDISAQVVQVLNRVHE
jgi:Skp family chaperone for outer membrane proteins